MRKWILIIFLLGFSLNRVHGQKDTINPSYFALKPQYGFIIPHSQSIKSLTNTNPKGIEGEYGWYLVQQQDWDRCNCYSRAGFSFLYIDYNNPAVLGQSLNLIAFVEPLLNYKGSWKASVRMGVGATYLTKVYDAEDNPENLFFSYPLSYLVHLDFNLTKYINPDLFVFFYGKYNHISNGGVKKPNKGMNFPTFGLGMGYNFRPLDFPQKEKASLQKPIPVIPFVESFFTGRTIHTEEQDEYKLAIGLSLKARRKVSRINAFSIGMEGIYDRSLYNKKESRGSIIANSYYSLLAGHAFVFGKFVFSQEWGTYLYAPFYENKDFFQRYSLTYNLFNNFRFGVTLKAHAEVAENFNVLITYDLR